MAYKWHPKLRSDSIVSVEEFRFALPPSMATNEEGDMLQIEEEETRDDEIEDGDDAIGERELEALQIEEGPASDEKEGMCESRECKVSLIIFFIVILLVAIVFGIIFGNRNENGSETTPENGGTTEQIEGAIYLKAQEIMQISSPDYPNTYPDQSEQYWIIVAPDNFRVRIEFIDIRTEYYYDKVRIGSSEETEIDYIASFTGYDLPPVITSSGRALWVQLHSDDVTGEAGFLANVTAVSADDAMVECDDGEMPCKYVSKCFSQADRCDGSYQCISGYDEVGCACANSYLFKCSDGKCIERDLVCSDVIDCSDDELNCDFQCDNTFIVSHAFVCDTTNDCGDYSDEKDCECTGERWECPDGTCIYLNNVCDDFPHCPGGADEQNCVCKSWQFQCLNSGVCIPYWERCDGNDTCGDSSDEQDCPACQDNLFECASHQCLPTEKLCNGKKDCYKGDDEMDCEDKPVPACADGEFQCPDGKCLRASLVCDGVQQCPKRTDEANCTIDSDSGTEEPDPSCTQCTSGECIPPEARCDGNADCASGEDETGCTVETTPPPSCPESEFLCSSDESCIPQSRVCNGIGDCPQREDETSCNETTDSCTGFAKDDYFVCDGKEDCPNGEDEECICGTKPAMAAKILGGRGTRERGAWPWQIMLTKTNDTSGVNCGGAIINRNWIITALHCVSQQSIGGVFIIAGVTDRKDIHEGIQYRVVSDVVEHPGQLGLYFGDPNASNGGNDLALVKVDEPFSYTAMVQPVCLPEPDIEIPAGEYVTVTGWGNTGSGLNPIQLMEARLPVIPPEVCDHWSYFSLQLLQERVLCAGYERGVISGCHGDSGGPLVLERNGVWTLVGTVSGGTTCGTPYTPNLFMRVSANVNWIRSVIGN